MTMLLTLCAGSLRSRMASPSGKGNSGMRMLDVPSFVVKELQLHGLNIPASMLSGCSPADLDRLRDAADKAACPCLVLIEDTPRPLASPDDAERDAAASRVQRLAVAANRLGCNAIALKIEAPESDAAFDMAADQVRSMLPAIERLELNVLLAPHTGLTATTERLTSLIKRIGGFRIGSLPSFGASAAAGGGDPIEGLRKLAPYAGAIHATVEGFNKKGAHKSWDLAACVTAIRSVGFLNTLAIDYTGDGDPVPSIEKARDLLQAAIDKEAA
ncbi:MAG TPA: TIM barrel protein [Phycisphaerales bacterium]|nr:TIM barrel protein [Phycisphaerales bacterium]